MEKNKYLSEMGKELMRFENAYVRFISYNGKLDMTALSYDSKVKKDSLTKDFKKLVKRINNFIERNFKDGEN